MGKPDHIDERYESWHDSLDPYGDDYERCAECNANKFLVIVIRGRVQIECSRCGSIHECSIGD